MKYSKWSFLIVSALFVPNSQAREATVVPPAEPSFSASSELASPKSLGAYSPAKLFDGDPTTAWCEGAEGLGIGERIIITWPETVEIDGFAFMPGFHKSEELFLKNSVPRKIHFAIDGKDFPTFLVGYRLALEGDDEDPKAVRGMGCYPTPADLLIPWRVVVFPETRKANRLALVIDSGKRGSAWADLLISEMVLFTVGKEPTGLPKEVLRAAKILIELRDGSGPTNLYAPRTQIHSTDDNRAYAQFLSMIHVKQPDTQIQEPVIETRQELNKAGSQATAWWAAQHPYLFDTALAIDGARIVGPVSTRHGDGEWVELYPEILLDDEDQIYQLGEAAYWDGVPGCAGGVIPSTAGTEGWRYGEE